MTSNFVGRLMLLATLIVLPGFSSSELTYAGAPANAVGLAGALDGTGAWSVGSAVQIFNADVDLRPSHSLAVAPGGELALLVFDDAKQTMLTLHACGSICTQLTSWSLCG